MYDSAPPVRSRPRNPTASARRRTCGQDWKCGSAITSVWRIIKRQRRSDARSMLPMSGRDPSHSARAKEVDDLLADVIHIGKHALSARQLCIVQMASEGYTIADIANHLGITVARASDEKYRSIQRIREIFNSE